MGIIGDMNRKAVWGVYLRRVKNGLLFSALVLVLLQRSVIPFTNPVEKVRAYTRAIEFDFVTWTFNAILGKGMEGALGTARYLSSPDRRALVMEYFDLVDIERGLNNEIMRVYADPAVQNAAAETEDARRRLALVTARKEQIAPVAEAVLQEQVSVVVAEMGLTAAGQPIPPVLYHTTALPYALIVSPREVIRQEADISLLAGMTVDEMEMLESQVEENLNYSALVVPVGGVGTYPTMVMQTSALDWLAEVIAHEWIHNYLTLRPLGINYNATPELRTMNETTASIAGKEIGYAVLAKFYPERLPPPPVQQSEPEPQQTPQPEPEPPGFDFRKEMHETRITADALLAEGKIEAAEAYMEARREVFWQNGYQIRKLNQAYFAFYGAYADQPGGAAGTDPVGPAVRALRAQSKTLAEFINRMAWMTSFEVLQAALQPQLH